MSETSSDDEQRNNDDNNQNDRYKIVKTELEQIAFDNSLKQIKSVLKHLLIEKNLQVNTHAELKAESDQPFVFCWSKELRKLQKLKKKDS